MTNPFPMVEKAVRQLIEQEYPTVAGRVGGDLAYARGDGFYVWLGLIPGGSTTQLEGEWVLDIDILADSYGTAMDHALAIEAALIGPRHVTSTMRLDNCYQNEGVAERPWDEESVYRLGATYTFTARRSG